MATNLRTRIQLNAALKRYEEALAAPQQGLLGVLLARDQVEVLLHKQDVILVNKIEKLVRLDEQLRQVAGTQSLAALSKWRDSRQPPEKSWWWFLDQGEKDQRWALLTIILLLGSVPFAVSVITRLWDGGADTMAVFVTLLTLILTSGTLTQRGQEIVRMEPTDWLLDATSLSESSASRQGVIRLRGFGVALVPASAK